VFSTRYVEISSCVISDRYLIKAGYIRHSRDYLSLRERHSITHSLCGENCSDGFESPIAA